VLIKVYPAPSHYNAIFDVACALKLRGHIVIFCGIREARRYAEKRGFNFIVERHDTAFNPFRKHESEEATNIAQSLRKLNDRELVVRESETFSEIAKRVNANLVLLDIHYSLRVLPLLSGEIKLALFSTKVALDEFTGHPPLNSPLLYRDTWACRLASKLQWYQYYIIRRLKQWYGRPDFPTTAEMSRLTGGVSTLKLRVETRRYLIPGLREIPEFILSPLAFDYPHKPRSNQIYIGAEPTHYREDIDCDYEFALKFDRIASERIKGKPLIYCSLGTIAQIYTGATSFLRRLVEASIGQPWNVIISTNLTLTKSEGSPNILVFEHVPQVRLLGICDLMVMHGGMNSIRECIFHEVPMLVYPASKVGDQIGNAARVVYHNIGSRGSLASDTANTIRLRIQQMLFDQNFYRSHLRVLKSTILSSTAFRTGVEVIENHMKTYPEGGNGTC